ncbi:hypothetical protein [Streptomyces sp. NPDC048636]|uniref:hypothetical protein n=1 Tax=Streptomyces sp. NPDC048636 TaxID=3155762 RepID=UPI00344ADEEE
MTSTPRRGPFAWIRAWFGGDMEPAANPFVQVDVAELETIHRSTQVTFETPAKGGGFDFLVEIRCDWCAEGRLDLETLRGAIDSYQAAMPQRLSERIRDIARRYEPFHVEEAERSINDALKTGECFEGGLVSCRTVASLQPAPEVVEQQRKAALELQEIEHRYAKSALRVRLLANATQEWREFLASGLVGARRDGDSLSWLTPWAVLLAEQPDKAATEVSVMYQQRQEHVADFIKLLQGQTKNYQSQDIFEFVVANERHLGHAMRLFGLPLPGESGTGDGPAEPLPRP